jgi:ADP-ribose pyrophosphatase YjhB (NUDIX family)
MIKNNTCNNCGKQGHQFHQCKLPITSYGIILFRSSEKGIQYLMLRRKDSFGYIDFLRGKYSQNNVNQIQLFLNEMSIREREQLLKNNFETLWINMWGIKYSGNIESQYKGESNSSEKKFEALKMGLQLNLNREIVTLTTLINNCTTKWEEPEWEFPKGRRNYHEKDLECALREFEEETGLSKEDIKVIENVIPIEEIFVGSNHKSYKHKYFLAYTEKLTDILTNYQKTEVSKLDWKTLDECLDVIRPYNLEKKQLIININKVLEEYRLY